MESDDAYTTHLQAEAFCNKQQEPVDDRLPYQMLKRLDFKKPPYAKAKDTEQKWKILYSVLFPDDTETPSPYDQHSFTPRLQQILFEALEEELIKKLVPAVEPIIQQIKQSIPAIIQNCKLRLLQANSDSESPYTPSSFAAVSSTDSERDGRQHQLASPPDSDAVIPKSISRAAKGKPLLHNGSPPSSSNPDDVQEPCHASSSGSIFDRHATTPSHACNTQENQACSPSNCLPEVTSYSSQSPRLENLGNPFPLLGSFAESYINTHSSEGTFESPNPPSTADSRLPQQNGLLVLNFDRNSTTSNISKDLQPPHSHPIFSSQLYSNCYTAPNDCNKYFELDALPVVSDFDPFPDILDFDQFHE